MIIYMRKRDKALCRVIETHTTNFGEFLDLRYEDNYRALLAGSWRVTRSQFDRLYKPWIDTDDIGDDHRGEGA